MTAAEARTMYRDHLTLHGRTFTLARGATTAACLGRIVNAAAGPATDTVQGSGFHAIILAEDLETAAFPVPPARGDALDDYMVTFVDDKTRRIGDTVIAYVLEIEG